MTCRLHNRQVIHLLLIDYYSEYTHFSPSIPLDKLGINFAEDPKPPKGGAVFCPLIYQRGGIETEYLYL